MRFPSQVVVLSLVVLLLLVASWYVFVEKKAATPGDGSSQGSVSLYDEEETGISFSYPSTYTLEKRQIEVSGSMATYLTLTPAKATLPEAGEGPPGLTVAVFENTQSKPLADWLQTMTNATGPAPANGWDYADAVIGGEDGIAYTSTGLYESDNVAVAHAGKIYIFSAAWLTREDQTLKDLSVLLTSARFK